MKSISGVVPIVPTPFVPGSEDIDTAALRRLVDFAVDAEAAAICLPAYGSEFYKLTDQERLDVVEVAVDQAGGRLPVMAQCNHGSAQGAAALARRAGARRHGPSARAEVGSKRLGDAVANPVVGGPAAQIDEGVDGEV